MSTNAEGPDPTMDAIGSAVALGREGAVASARRDLIALWRRIGPAGDAFHRCKNLNHLHVLFASANWLMRARAVALTPATA